MGDEPGIAELEAEVEKRRQTYQEALDAEIPNPRERALPVNDTGALIVLATRALSAFDVQRAKVPYDEAVRRLEGARDRDRQRLADDAQTRAEQAQVRNQAMQRSMTKATVWIAVSAVVAAVAAVLALFRHS
jgi:hypothetical protein